MQELIDEQMKNKLNDNRQRTKTITQSVPKKSNANRLLSLFQR